MFSKKIVLLGDTAVGKTSLCARLVNGTFDSFSEPTIGAAFLTKTVQTGDITHRLEIWDTAGQERYKSLTPMYYRKAQVALICYDSSKRNSFETAKSWYKQVTEKADQNCVKIMVGNKSDIIDKFVVNDAINFCERKGIQHISTSAKNDVNITKLFVLASHKCMESGTHISKLDLNLKINDLEKDRYKYCCYR